MTTPPVSDLWQNQALRLVQALDRLRDNPMPEDELLTALATTLAEATKAELCILAARDDDSGDLQLRAITDRAAVFDGHTEAELRAFLQRAGDAAGQTLLEAEFALPNGQRAFGLAAPLRVGDIPLGAVVLLNTGTTFTDHEEALVTYALVQIDSAVQQTRLMRQLRQRQKELETVYRIDRLRDKHDNFDAMLTAVLGEVCYTIEAQAGFIMLYTQSGHELELRASTDTDLFGQAEVMSLLRVVSETAVRSGFSVNRTYTGRAVASIVGVPLILQEKLIGVLGVINRKNRPAFTRSDLSLLSAIASQIDTAIFENLQTQRLRSAFGMCVGPQVMDRLLSIGDRDVLSGERKIVTTLFSDIRGFTSMSEQIPAEMLQEVINDHLSTLTDLVLAYEGTLDKYIGDCVMCFFNAPEHQPDHAQRAVRLAVEMHQAHHHIMARWKDRLPLPPIGIGISTGEAMLGNFGSTRRLEYTALGRDVNLAARLCGAAEADQTLISPSTYTLVKDLVHAEAVAGLHLKGIGDDVTAWSLLGLKS